MAEAVCNGKQRVEENMLEKHKLKVDQNCRDIEENIGVTKYN